MSHLFQVFSQRMVGKVNFFRPWDAYKAFFGEANTDYWLGNDMIHKLTEGDTQRLKIDLTYRGQVKYADYSTFWIDNEAQNYKLTVSGFSGATPPGLYGNDI